VKKNYVDSNQMSEDQNIPEENFKENVVSNNE
jgi:hypothetical protein